MGGWLNHFIGTLFSRQFIYTYAIGSGVTTAGYALYLLRYGLWGRQQVITADPAGLGAVIDLYVRILLPIWIPPITGLELLVVATNCFIALWVLAWWSEKYADATGGRRRSSRGF